MKFTLHDSLPCAFPDFHSKDSDFFLNPTLSEVKKCEIVARLDMAPHLDSHIVICTSGSEGEAKIVALSKAAMLRSARRLNAAFQVNSGDRWFCPLPLFHVGGLAIGARAQEASLEAPSLIQFGSWKAQNFVDSLTSSRATLCSLVPTQVADLLVLGARAPATLRAVLVGGAALPHEQYLKAAELGWNLIPSYGMSESAAVFALAKGIDVSGSGLGTAEYDVGGASFVYKSLPGSQVSFVDVGLENSQRLALTSDSLASGFLKGHKSDEIAWQPLANPYLSGDRGRLVAENEFLVLGRVDELIKIRGEFFDLGLLRQKLRPFLLEHGVLDFSIRLSQDQRGLEIFCSLDSNDATKWERLNQWGAQSQLGVSLVFRQNEGSRSYHDRFVKG